MTKLVLSPSDISSAASIADQLRAEARKWSDAAWALDSALSLRRKAQPGTGYRSSEVLGDAPWNMTACDTAVQAAADNGLLLLLRA